MPITSSPSRRWNRFYWFALVFVWALYIFDTLLCYLAKQPDPYPATALVVTIILSGVIIGYKWAFKRMAGFQSDVKQVLIGRAITSEEPDRTTDWYELEFNRVFDWRKSIALAVLFTVVALLIALKIEVAASFPTRVTHVGGFFLYILIGTAFGACVWPGYRMSVFVYNLTKLGPQINPFMPSNVGIFNIARTLIKFEAVGILLILLFGVAFGMSPYRMSNGFILWSAIGVTVIWSFWFYFTQSQIHNAMVKYKHEMQLRFAEHYQKRLSFLLRHPEPKGFEELERLTVLRREIESIPVWPFNIRNLITSLGLVITPVVAALAQRLLAK